MQYISLRRQVTSAESESELAEEREKDIFNSLTKSIKESFEKEKLQNQKTSYLWEQIICWKILRYAILFSHVVKKTFFLQVLFLA